MSVRDSGGVVWERVDPRVRRTRELIVRAFGELIAERGHAGLTVREIAERATINRATFYAHFDDQYELFDHFVSEAFREELRRRLPSSPGLSRENLEALVLAVCHYVEGLNTGCSRTDRQFRPLIEARVQGEVHDVLLGWIRALPPRRRPANPEVAASVVSWAVFGAGLDWARHAKGRTAQEIAGETLAVILDGLGDAMPVPSGVGG